MKRNREMNKYYKYCLKDLDNILGECDAGLLIATILKLIHAMQRDNVLNLRTMEIKFNDYFSAKWDFDEGDYVK